MYTAYSQMQNWVSSAAVRGGAEAVAQDGATYAEVASGAEPSWRDLRAYFQLSSWDGTNVYDGGGIVTSAGNSVSTAAGTVAKHLFEFAARLEQLEKERSILIEQAKGLNRWFASRSGNDAEDDAWEDKAFKQSLLEDQIFFACREYQEICENLASSLKKMEDDGSDPNPGVQFFKGTVKVGVFVAGFIPPVTATATVVVTTATAIGGAIAIHDAYQSRTRELKEEHPELSDSQIQGNATTTAIVSGGTKVAIDVATAGGGKMILGNVTDLPAKATGPISTGASKVVSIPAGYVVDEITGPITNSLPSAKVTSAWPVDASPYVNASAVAAQMQESTAQDRVRETKDYDGDGYTDPAFRPGSEETEYDPRIKTATVVVTPEDED